MRLINADTLPNYEVDMIARVGDAAGPAKMRFVLWEDIQKAPVIDAAPIVRCNDCKFRGDGFRCPLVIRVRDTISIREVDCASDDDFCSKGKPKDEKEG